jgi:DNA adenine methylase
MRVNKSLFGYIGGKQRLSAQIINYVPDHKIYVEPFFGSGALYFKKGYKQVSNNNNYIEVINDLDYNVTNFFEQLRDNYQGLERKLRYFEHSEYLHKNSKTNSKYYQEADNTQKACLFFFNILNSFSRDLNHGFTYSRQCNNVMSFRNKVGLLNAYSKRLKDSIIFNRHYKSCIDKFDTVNSFFYFDPPYKDRVKYNIQKKKELDFDQLAADIKSIKGRWMVSHYRDDWVLDNFSDYTIVNLKHYRSCKKIKNGGKHDNGGHVECIVMNYDINQVDKWTGKEQKKTLTKDLI